MEHDTAHDNVEGDHEDGDGERDGDVGHVVPLGLQLLQVLRVVQNLGLAALCQKPKVKKT